MATIDAHMQAFVDATLDDFASWFEQEAKDRIRGRNIVVDEVLLKSLAVKTAKNTLEMWFKDHGRMHDMGAGRGYHKGKFMGAEERGQFLKGRKPSKWYSRLAWGAVFGTLANNLANMYIAQVPGQLTKVYKEA